MLPLIIIMILSLRHYADDAIIYAFAAAIFFTNISLITFAAAIRYVIRQFHAWLAACPRFDDAFHYAIDATFIFITAMLR